jgi:hypothetical protein
MKFLVLIHGKDPPAPPLENPLIVFQAAKEYIEAMRANGSLECAYAHLDGRGVAIANADTSEELYDQLSGYPFVAAGRADFDVYPIIDADYFFDRNIERLQQMSGD